MSKRSPACRHHAVGAGHEAGRRRQRHAAGIFERFPGLEHRLLADHAGAAHLLQPPERIGDPPVAGLELHRLLAVIGDRDRVGPEEIAVFRRRAVGEEARRHRDLDIAGGRAVHFPSLTGLIGAGASPQMNRTRVRRATVTANAFSTARDLFTIRRMNPRAPVSAMVPAIQSQRDLRLDLFRGLALWLIFLDHIPSNVVSWITIRNYGFSDATEIFVFISGYTAAFVYGRAMRERGVLVASARILRRAWQIYVAHMFLFVIYMAEIAYVATRFNPLYNEEMGIFDFLKQPDVTLIQALLLKFKPVNMDVLPLYIVLLARLSAGAVALAPRPDGRTRGLGHPLCAHGPLRLELPGLSERRLGVQSVRLAASVRVRRLVRARRGRTHQPAHPLARRAMARIRVCAVRVRGRDHLARAAARRPAPDVVQRLDLSDRQDQPRRAANRALPVAGGAGPAFRPARLAGHCNGRSFVPRSCAASIRWKSSASACSWRSPGISCSSRCPTGW